MPDWTQKDIPDLTGRTIIVTGANTGLGLQMARDLSAAGADVTMASRSEARGKEALQSVLASKPKGTVSLELLDISDLDSVKAFVSKFAAGHKKLDVLIDNAGTILGLVGGSKEPPRTKHGFEITMGTNHFGTFALTGLLLPLLRQTPGSRVVVVSSNTSFQGKLDLDDLNYENQQKSSYSAATAYSTSKLANLCFVREANKRLGQSRLSSPTILAAHPGWSSSNGGGLKLIKFLSFFGAQKTEHGVWPIEYQATALYVKAGSYVGPTRMGEMRGPPGEVKPPETANDDKANAKLWQISEELTGVRWDI